MEKARLWSNGLFQGSINNYIRVINRKLKGISAYIFIIALIDKFDN